ncbi:MAG: hypothetical protein ABJA87_04765 [bacterium]
MDVTRAGDDPAAGAADRPAGVAVPGEIRLVAAVLALQASGLVIIAVVLVTKTLIGDPRRVAGALSAVALAVAAAAILLFAARSLLRLRPGLRTPVIVLELLALPVGYSLGFQAGRMGYAAPLLLSAVLVLYLLFTPAVRALLDR